MGTIVEQSSADVGWLAWLDRPEAIVVPREPDSPFHRADVTEFPDPPLNPVIIKAPSARAGWLRWCRVRGIQSCLVVPVIVRDRILGSAGLASTAADALGEEELDRLVLVASLAVHARRYEARLAGLRSSFDEVSRTLENALALDRALRLPPSYRDIARSVGKSLDSSYCRIAIRGAGEALTIRAAGGHRPPRSGAWIAWPLEQLTRCREALLQRRAVVLKFNRHDSVNGPERLALFSSTTKAGIILPFFAGPRTQGVLIIGEERRSRCQPLSPERVAILELIASRVGHIMRMARRLEYERLADRRRERRTTIERQRLARELHDEIGQSLNALLVQLRCAITRGSANKDELRALERTATNEIDSVGALAYGVRHLERGVGPLEHAHSYSETILRAAGCSLLWTEDRTDVKVAGKKLREVGRVVKESVSNVVRHAQAKHVRIRVEHPNGMIRVTIRDDGVGFRPLAVRPISDGRGLGLIGNAERIARLGGAFDVRSSPKRGTLVVLEVPRQ